MGKVTRKSFEGSVWLMLTQMELEIERKQCLEEGKDF
jgi:hypothetical protein